LEIDEGALVVHREEGTQDAAANKTLEKSQSKKDFGQTGGLPGENKNLGPVSGAMTKSRVTRKIPGEGS